eukprot:749390-Alexandrium_andersonii.AAC.1
MGTAQWVLFSAVDSKEPHSAESKAQNDCPSGASGAPLDAPVKGPSVEQRGLGGRQHPGYAQQSAGSIGVH